MSEQHAENTPHNDGAISLLSLNYESFRSKSVYWHSKLYHEFGHTPPLHIPVTMDGVVP